MRYYWQTKYTTLIYIPFFIFPHNRHFFVHISPSVLEVWKCPCGRTPFQPSEDIDALLSELPPLSHNVWRTLLLNIKTTLILSQAWKPVNVSANSVVTPFCSRMKRFFYKDWLNEPRDIDLSLAQATAISFQFDCWLISLLFYFFSFPFPPEDF